MGFCNCKCDKKRWLLVTLAVAVAYFVMDMFFHHNCLGGLYTEHAHLFRSFEESRALFPWMYLGYIAFSLIFTCLYGFGVEVDKKGWLQGVRYGFWMGLLFWGAMQLLYYPFVPYPDAIYFGWFLVGLFEFVVLGAIVGMLHKAKK